jgi:hypothetical protein
MATPILLVSMREGSAGGVRAWSASTGADDVGVPQRTSPCGFRSGQRGPLAAWRPVRPAPVAARPVCRPVLLAPGPRCATDASWPVPKGSIGPVDPPQHEPGMHWRPWRWLASPASVQSPRGAPPRRQSGARLVTTNFKPSDHHDDAAAPYPSRHPLTVSKGCACHTVDDALAGPAPHQRGLLAQEDAFAGATAADTATQEVLLSGAGSGAPKQVRGLHASASRMRRSASSAGGRNQTPSLRL